MKANIIVLLLLIASISSNAQNERRGNSEKRDNGRQVKSASSNQNERGRNNNTQPSTVNRGREQERHGNDTRSNFRQSQHVEDNNRNKKVYRSTVVEIRRPSSRVEVVRYRPNYHPVSIDYRRRHYAYRMPYRTNLIWSVNMSRNFGLYYPEVRYWRYNVGHCISVVPAYNADGYIGEVASIYGKVFDTNYSYENDELYIYFGDYYPYHDFSIVIPGREARKLSRHPELYFIDQNVSVTGYVSVYGDKPEVIVRDVSQLDIY